MKKYIILALGFFAAILAHAQTVQTWTENFDTAVNFIATPSGSWNLNSTYYAPNSTGINPKSCFGQVPHTLGSTITLQTPVYDFSTMNFIILRFDQICKVSPMDTVLIQYQESGTSVWTNLPAATYMGKAANFNTRGFNAGSYPDWKADDSTVVPQNTWWKEEIFDLSTDLQYGYFAFRFVIKRGKTQGTQQSYGWLLDNFEVTAATYPIRVPTVEFISPLVKDTVYSTGAWEINARVKTNTTAPIVAPWLVWTKTQNGVSIDDSVLMTKANGDSLWKANIPKYELGTTVTYSILGKDTFGNYAIANSKYVIAHPGNFGPARTVIVGNRTTTDTWIPICTATSYYWGWSRHLYYASELGTTAGGGTITRLAWETPATTTASYTLPNQICYMQATNDVAINGTYVDPATTPGVTQVYSGSINLAAGWCEVILDQPFFLPPGQNLVVHWYYLQGVASPTPISFYHTTATAVRNSDHPSTTLANVPVGGSNNSYYADARFVFGSETGVSIFSVDIKDTITVKPGIQVPIYATIKNKDQATLTSADIYYSINGGAPQLHKWTGSVSWDYNTSDSIGLYTPKVNGHDTITVWIKLPNGAPDGETYDDTVTKIIYGSSDIVMAFVTTPADTVTNTGPFAISARITTLSGIAVGAVSLDVVTTNENYILPMTVDASGNLYRTTIPHTVFGSDVQYSITLTDNEGNVVTIEKSFFIKSPAGGDANSVAIVSVNTPEQGGNKAGDLIPIHVTIRNKGTQNLDSCLISWTLNGVFQKEITYYGELSSYDSLPPDFTDTITLDYYSVALGQRDTLWVKVSMPNNAIDPAGNDDSLRVTTLGCSGDLQGEINVGAGETFTKIANVLASIRECSLTGDLTLKLKGDYEENVDLTNLTPFMRGYSLTITSSDNHPDSAVIQPTTGVGITLGNTRDIVLKNITVTTAHLNTSAVQFTAVCTNVVIRDCKLLVNPASTAETPASIYKGSGTGNVDSIFIIHNIMDGGGSAFYFYGGTGTGVVESGGYGRMGAGYGTNVIFDSNTCTNNTHSTLKIWYTDFLHISYNNISSRVTSTTRWDPFSITYANGDIIGNRLSSSGAQEVQYFHLSHYNWNNISKSRALIANNEIIHTGSGVALCLYHNWMYSEIMHNSFYVSSTNSNGSNAFYWEQIANGSSYLRNNNVVINSPNGQVFVQAVNGQTLPGGGARYDVDYCNFYHSTNFNLATFRQNYAAPNIVSVMPDYVNINVNADVRVGDISVLSAPVLPAITQDIVGKPRTGQATMGAYQINPHMLDFAINQFISLNTEVVRDQTVSINIEVQNAGETGIQDAVFGWSINGDIKPSFSMPTTSLPFLGKQNLTIGSFVVDDPDTYDIAVWLESVNSTTDMYQGNDTLRAVVNKVPLAEWVAPFVADTITLPSFTVNAMVRTATGAPVSIPKLMFTSIVEGKYILHDSVAMIRNSGTWQAVIPEQYYNTMVIYSLTVSDALGNTSTITDSTYINFSGFGIINPNLIIGTGTGTTTYSPFYSYSNYAFARMYYMDYEIDPQRRGGYIRSIGFNSTSSGISCDNITFYLKAVSDSVITNANYIDPIADGATLVWGSATVNIQVGWNTFTLDAPFYLPPGKNLLIYCNDQDGNYSNNGGTYAYWQYTTISPAKVCYYSTTAAYTWPPTTGYTNTARANLQLDIYGSTPYTGYNLAVSSLLRPINDPNSICSDDYSPVEIVLTNMGSNDYDFTQNRITLGYEINDEAGHQYSGTLNINTGKLESTKSDTIEVMSALPIMYSGTYDIKIWLSSSIDNIVYDDTLYYVYTSSRIGLPLDADFSDPFLPVQFVVTAPVGGSVWAPYTPAMGDPVQPNPGNGTGVLRFDGAIGTMSVLSSRQLDLYGSIRPQLEFWYYHDASLSDLDNSYTDVNIVLGGVSNTVMTLYKRGTTTGWGHYTVPLNQYTGSSQCLLVQFETMNMSSNSSQYIDRIIITSEQNLAVSEIILSPETTICALTNKELKVVLSTATNQTIDLSNYSTSLAVEVPGYPTFDIPLQNAIEGLSSDTIPIGTIDIASGTNTVIRAYLTSPVDGSPVNDTATFKIDMRPALSVEVNSLTGGADCFKIGSPVQQDIVLHNTGNVDIPEIELVLRIDGVIQVRETIFEGLAAYTDTSYTFVTPYTVPTDGWYQVQVTAYMSCDSIQANGSHATDECADLHDVTILSLDNPPLDQIDDAGSTESITVSVRNTDNHNSFVNVVITAVIEDENGQPLNTFSGVIPEISSLETKSFTFTEKYVVPNSSTYSIRIYLANGDSYPENDTLIVSRQTNFGEIGISLREANVLTLGQNIPNPATNTTRIDYNIPETGDIIFYVHSVSGQLLYSKTIEAASGKQSLELNTSSFAAGIYFYSIEYKGQRLVKRMMISGRVNE